MAWFWGLLGSLWYAAPLLATCIQERMATGRRCWPCVAEAVVALVCGTIAASALTPWAMETMGQTSPAMSAALATLIGLAQKKIAPALTKAFTQTMSGFISKQTPPES